MGRKSGADHSIRTRGIEDDENVKLPLGEHAPFHALIQFDLFLDLDVGLCGFGEIGRGDLEPKQSGDEDEWFAEDE